MKAKGAALSNKHSCISFRHFSRPQGNMDSWNKDAQPHPKAVNMTHDSENMVWHDFLSFVDRHQHRGDFYSMSHHFDISVQDY